jgi:KTSC domain
MKRTPVTSSNIRSIGFDPTKGLLEIEFTNGRVYQYTGKNVQQHHQSMLHAPSAGEYFNAQVRHNPQILGHEVKP